jgi:hypothetical protein
MQVLFNIHSSLTLEFQYYADKSQLNQDIQESVMLNQLIILKYPQFGLSCPWIK